MEAGEIAFDCDYDNSIRSSYTLAYPVNCPTKSECSNSPGLESVPASSPKRRKVNADNQYAQEKDTQAAQPIWGVSSCYVFKSRLQEYCQKAGLTTPVYETIKEGPSHEPFFRSAVIVNGVRYDSLPGFFNRKAAEQSAAEIALVELANSVDMKFGISQPVHETGLCKNLLQEYAQKMNYAIPLYECHKEEKQGRIPMYSCVVEIGGIRYIGASASTKKEAEIKAARTAMIAIRSADDQTNNSIYTVLPQKKKVPNTGIGTQDNTKKGASKQKKGRSKWRVFKKRKCGRGTTSSDVKTDGGDGLVSSETMANTCGLGDCKANLVSI
ncbi:Double-stranded RNA-binding protein 1 [Orobanche gracilis]